MKILIESYNTAMQNISGGIQNRIRNLIKYLPYDCKVFNKWNDQIKDYDLLHIFKANIEDYQLLRLAKEHNKPVVISSVIPIEKKTHIRINLILGYLFSIHTGYWFIRQMLKQADIIIAQTKKEAFFIVRNYKISYDKIQIVPNGVNYNKEQINNDEIYTRIGFKGKYILQVGRFDKNKNQLNVIKAMSNENIPIVFIGGQDPSQADYYEKCLKSSSPNMHFLGWLDNNDSLLKSAFQNAHVVILPSYKEIFGNSLLEGGAYGANLIATRELPVEDWGLKDYCYIINPNSTKDIKEKILSAYKQPLNNEVRTFIRKKFSWETVIKQHINIYEQLIANKFSND